MYRKFSTITVLLVVILLLFSACSNDYIECDTFVIHKDVYLDSPHFLAVVLTANFEYNSMFWREDYYVEMLVGEQWELVLEAQPLIVGEESSINNNDTLRFFIPFWMGLNTKQPQPSEFRLTMTFHTDTHDLSYHEVTTYFIVDNNYNHMERLSSASTPPPIIRGEVLQNPHSNNGEPWIVDIYPIQIRGGYQSRAIVIRVIDDYSRDSYLVALWLSDEVRVFKSWGELVLIEDISAGNVINVWGSTNYNTNLTIDYIEINSTLNANMVWIVD